MLAIVKSFGLEGIEGYPIDVEVDIGAGLPAFDIVGMATTGVKEAKNRVKSALKNSFLDIPPKKITVNLAPADIKKEGTAFDLPIAVGLLIGNRIIQEDKYKDFILVGELSLDGTIRKINGIMPMLISALQKGYKKFIIPYDNFKEASYIKDCEVYALKKLSDAVAFLSNLDIYERVPSTDFKAMQTEKKYNIDLSDVKGQTAAKRALEIAVAGGHNIILNGPPGAGKTMLAKCVPTIMPALTFEEAIEVTKIHSVAGILDQDSGIVTKRPFRSPHHTASTVSLTGGGAHSVPGEYSLAHNGVLFLDEMPEYERHTLETLRQPLEDGRIMVTRVAKSVDYLAEFMLIASRNPCPCGNLGNKLKKCTCTFAEIKRYNSRLSGPLMDRIDIAVDVDNVTYGELRESVYVESSETVRERVERVRNIQRERFSGDGIYCNAQMNSNLISKYCKIDDKCEEIMKAAFTRYGLSARAFDRILKVARTIADIEESKDIGSSHILEAVQYRCNDTGIKYKESAL